nr:immunoglobulin heavy chain junction region [Macaca mulatta]
CARDSYGTGFDYW